MQLCDIAGEPIKVCHAHSGEKSLLDQDIPAVAMAHPDGNFASSNLYSAIAAGNYPEW